LRISRVIPLTDRQTNRQTNTRTEVITLPPNGSSTKLRRGPKDEGDS